MRYLDTPKPRLFGHRGACGLAPENTLESFRVGLDAGARLLELDVHATRDGHVVVLHDPTVDRTTDGSGPIRALTLARAQELDAGCRFVDARGRRPFAGRGVRIPTLAEVLERFPGVPLNIEIKQGEPAIEQAVLAVLDRFDARDQVLLAAEDHAIMARIREASSDVLTSFSAVEVADFLGACAGGLEGYHPPGAALQVPPAYEGIEIVTSESVELAHRIGLEVHVWTINDPDRMRALLALGVDGLITDYPDRAHALLAAG